MRIISNFKDYYDIGMSEMDKSIVFLRKSEETIDFSKILKHYPNVKNPSHFYDECFYDFPRESFFTFMIGFCGKTYIGCEFSFNDFKNPEERIITYDENEILKLITERFDASSYTISMHMKDIKKLFLTYDGKDTNVCIEEKIPIFVICPIHEYGRKEREILKTNSNLSRYDFFKKFDSYSAFQELSMFIGGKMGSSEKEMVTVDDKHRIISHGFDEKSFRQEAPGRKKEQRKRNKELKRTKKQNSIKIQNND